MSENNFKVPWLIVLDLKVSQTENKGLGENAITKFIFTEVSVQ
jgi:hypothetical protein